MVKNLPAMQEIRIWSLGQEDPLVDEMAIHSSTLAWRIPWAGDPGRLQYIGSELDMTEGLTLLWTKVALFFVCFLLYLLVYQEFELMI